MLLAPPFPDLFLGRLLIDQRLAALQLFVGLVLGPPLLLLVCGQPVRDTLLLLARGLRCCMSAFNSSVCSEALDAFGADAAVLLVPLFGGASGAGGGGAAGLTLTQASLAVLLEPALQPGIERQAAGRICRIGQSEACTCVRIIVDDTIESKILQWQQIRLADGASANPALTLNDFAVLAAE